jgi:hypothetical protein
MWKWPNLGSEDANGDDEWLFYRASPHLQDGARPQVRSIAKKAISHIFPQNWLLREHTKCLK